MAERNLLTGTETVIERLLSQIPDKCFQTAHGSADKFAACMEQNLKAVQREAGRWDLRNAFAAAQLGKCVKAAGGNADAIKKCEQEAENTVKEAQATFDKATRA